MPCGVRKAAQNCYRGGGTDMELLIRVVNKYPENSDMFEKSSQRGDVISICPDGWGWSDAERNNPDWIIVSADITQAEVDALLEPGRAGEPQYRRRVGVEVDGIHSGDVLTRDELTARLF